MVIGIGVFYFYDLGQYLSLESLKSHRDQLHDFYQQNTWTMILGFIGVYIVTVALSLPGATILTLTSGAIFGAAVGTLVVNVGATLGALLAFLAARFILSDWVESKVGARLQRFQEGFSQNALQYLLFLRLVPLFPFWLINLAAGLTRIRTSTYVLGTMVGILPGSFVYANAGNHIASINTLKDIASPKVLGAFALLGLFALIPAIYHKIKARRAESAS
jgi:uncharacterized membrane protein YdjX (TVP38/TMEM64 family)